MKFVRLVLFSLCLFLVSCSSTDGELMRADKLMETAPDSALSILKRIIPEKYKLKQNRALYALLMSQALDKNDIKVESDSLIKIATAYYDEDEPVRAAYAYLYLARCEKNQGNTRNQAMALLKAQDFASKCNDPKLQGLVYTDKADMYQSQDNNDSCIVYNKLGLRAFQKVSDLRNSVLTLIGIGCGERLNESYDSATYYYSLAEKMATPLHENLITSSIYRNLSVVAYKQKNFKLALQYLRLVPITNDTLYDYNKWYMIGRMFVKSDQLDSARIYLNKVKSPGIMSVDYYKLWQELYEKQGRLAESLYYAKKVAVLKDSIQNQALKTSFAGMEKKYRFERLSVENKNLIIENKQNGIILLVALLLLSILCIVLLFWRIKSNKRKLIVQNQMLEQERSLKEKEKENNFLLQQQMKMQHLLLKNVEQYRSRAIKRSSASEVEKTVGAKSSKIDTFYEELMSHIDLTHRNISIRLKAAYPNLTKRDILICCLLLANFDTGMIATILDVQSESINIHRGRLRKKLNLQNQDNFLQFLRSF